MDPILELAREFGLEVIEDCAQAHGATFKGRPVGSMGTVGAFSFCQDKIITTAGEGGMLVTNSAELFESAWSFKDNGKSYDAVYRRNHAPGFRWLHESFGTNWRMTEIQSAVGRMQIRKLNDWVASRRRNASILREAFARCTALRCPIPAQESIHSHYRCYAFIRPERLRPEWTRDKIIEEIKALGVPCTVGSCSEIYLERAFAADMRPSHRLPVAVELGETSMAFLVHPTLSEENMQYAGKVVERVLSEATA
jgi:hypothetical protein